MLGCKVLVLSAKQKIPAAQSLPDAKNKRHIRSAGGA